MKNIVFYINSFFPIIGGAQTQALNLARNLISKGVNVSIITRAKNETLKQEIIEEVPVVRLNCFGGHYTRVLTFFCSSFYYFIKNRKSFDIIQTFQMDSNAIIACLIGFILKKKVYIRIACSGILGEINLHNTFMWKLSFFVIKTLAHGFIVLNKQSENDLMNCGIAINKIYLLRNGVDTNVYKPEQKCETDKIRKKLLIDNKLTVLFVGRLCLQKGIHNLLDAWKIFYNDFSQLILLGTGSEENMIRERITKENIRSVIIAHSNNPIEYYQISDIFVLPSIAEGTSNALLEAMGCGKIVIGTKIDGIKDIIVDNYNGFLVDNDPIIMAEKMKVIQSNIMNCQKISFNASETIKKNFDIKMIAEKYIQFLNIIK